MQIYQMRTAYPTQSYDLEPAINHFYIPIAYIDQAIELSDYS